MMVNVSDARRELVHVRASETSAIINSKHESLPHRVFIKVFVSPHTHIISPISPIRIHKNRIKTPDSSGHNPGFANKPHSGYYSIKCDNFYNPEVDGGISILDDTLDIDWIIPTEHANLSEKDTKHAMLKDFDSPFDINVDLY